jgi:hypothetical protein
MKIKKKQNEKKKKWTCKILNMVFYIKIINKKKHMYPFN